MSASPADQNLLFGILALQNGFISREDLIAATSVWIQDKTQQLREILLDRDMIDARACEALAALMLVHLQQHDADPQKSLAALSAVGSSVQAELNHLDDPDVDASLGHVGKDRERDDHYATQSFTIGDATAEGKRFRILRPHAKGGLGQVSVALDEELNREVALKEIQPEHADEPASRERFVKEAEVTGKLEHPGIVPVYGLGQYADGRPFYAMRFIRGDSLKDAIATFHSKSEIRLSADDRNYALRQLLGRFIDVCNAVEYAHSRGVLHRDLKPGNVMLGDYGETLVVDWGLTKLVDRPDDYANTDESIVTTSSGSGVNETIKGVVIGTPAFMSPEQAAGQLDRMGTASDVYCLGATLYALLTGDSPFDAKDPEVLQKVQRGTFPRPRSVDSRVPRPLEAICLKAMATNPEERYKHARDIAEDVERWLGDQPVTAWKEPIVVRAKRWTSRHQTFVVSTAVSLFTATVALTVLLGTIQRQNSEIQSRNEHINAQNSELVQLNAELAKQKEVAESNFSLAENVLDDVVNQIVESPHVLANAPETQALTSEILKRAKDYYRQLIAADDQPRTLLARAYVNLLGVLVQTETLNESHLEMIDEAMKSLAMLRAEGVKEEIQMLEANIHNWRIVCLLELRDPERALAACESSIKSLEQIKFTTCTNVAVSALDARATYATVLREYGDPAQASHMLHEVLNDAALLRNGDNGDLDFQLDMTIARCHLVLAQIFWKLNDDEKAAEHLSISEDMVVALREIDLHRTVATQLLMVIHWFRFDLRNVNSSREDKLQHIRDAIACGAELISADPMDVRTQRMVRELYVELGKGLVEQGQITEGWVALLRSLHIKEATRGAGEEDVVIGEYDDWRNLDLTYATLALLARADALRGNLDSASRWLRLAQERQNVNTPNEEISRTKAKEVNLRTSEIKAIMSMVLTLHFPPSLRDAEKAMELAEESFTLHDSYVSRMALAACVSQGGDYEKAVRLLRENCDDAPEMDRTSIDAMIQSYSKREPYQQANVMTEQMASLSKNIMKERLLLIVCDVKRKSGTEIEETEEVSFMARRRLAQGLFELGREYFNAQCVGYGKGLFREAAEQCQRVLEKEPNDDDLKVALATTWIYQAAGELYDGHRIDMVEQLLSEARSLLDKAPPRAGELWREMSRMRDVVEAELQNAKAWTLATSQIEEQRDAATAIDCATNACACDGENYRYRTTLAVAYAASGDFVAAVGRQRDALHLASDNAKLELHCLLGRLLRKQAFAEEPDVWSHIGLSNVKLYDSMRTQ